MSRPLWGKVAPTGDGRGELASKYRLPHNQRTYPHHHRATNPHYTRKAIQYRLPHNQRTYPHHHRATNPHYTRKAIHPRKRAPPLRALTGPPLPKGRGFSLRRRCMYYCAKFVSEYHR